METRLTLLVALAFLVLLWNTAMAWFIYRAFARSARRVLDYQDRSARLIGGFEAALERVKSASIRATEWSAEIRNGVVDAAENVDRADNWLQYGLAKVDFKVDKVFTEIARVADETKGAMAEPLYST